MKPSFLKIILASLGLVCIVPPKETLAQSARALEMAKSYSMSESNFWQLRQDSLKREIAKKIVTEDDKKEIKSCFKEKTAYLQKCREADKEYLNVEKKLKAAKLSNKDANSQSIQSLMEQKFNLEKSCDEAYSGTSGGQQCQAGETSRLAKLNKILEHDQENQAFQNQYEKARIEEEKAYNDD